MSDIISSKLDAAQIVRKSYDETANRIRVDASISHMDSVEVVIDAASGDNIAISSQDGTKKLNINSDGSINIGSGTVTANQGTNPWIISGNVTTISSVGSIDAFARQRVSEPFTLGDYKHIYGLDPNFIEYVLNGATISFQPNQACARLTTSSNTSSHAIHQTKFYHHYMPGKSQLTFASFNFYTAVTNVTKRTGYFDDNNGIFFEQTGNGTLNIVLRSYVSGSPVETRIPQSAWNIDKCDGIGTSGFNLDITKTQLLFIDFQWLGVGRVRVGFAHNGNYIEAHEFNGSNNLTTVYMSNPNLPIRCEILNTGATTGGYLDQICTTVISEGGYTESGIDWAIANPSLRTLAIGATLPIMAIRLKTAYKTYANRIIVRLGNVNIFSDSGNISYTITKLPNGASLTGGSGVWTSANINSGVEYYTTATGFSGGDILDGGYCASAVNGGNKSGGAPSANLPSSAKKNYIVQNFDSSDSEIYIITATNIDSKSTNVGVNIQWREIY